MVKPAVGCAATDEAHAGKRVEEVDMELRTAVNPELVEIARRLTPDQRELLQSLSERGPGLLFELAVGVLKFPEQIGADVQLLRDLGLIETSTISGSRLGSEVLHLSPQGREVVRLLREETLHTEAKTPALQSMAPAPPDPRQTEIELLRKLGDTAAQQGEWEKAQQWYKQALEIAQQVTGSSSVGGGG
jgi:tetratricopeptide (TPR) repeat protein